MNEVLRQEKKFLINMITEAALRKRLEEVMLKDPHNGAFGYRIRSLYFDTPEERDFSDKIEGIELRRKLRLRIYSPDSDFAILEMKQKSGQYQKKRSLRLERKNAESLVKGRYSVLLEYKEPFAAECFLLMNEFCYRPKTIVEYIRRAYIAKENRIRITIDTHLCGGVSLDLFSEKLPLYPALDSSGAVLEVKYNGFLLSYIKQLVDVADCSEISLSKYCLVRNIGF